MKYIFLLIAIALVAYTIYSYKKKATTAPDLTLRQIVDLIDELLNGTIGPYDWNDFLTLPMKDPEIDNVRKECAAIARKYPPQNKKDWCSEAGKNELLAISERLKKEIKEKASARRKAAGDGKTLPGRPTMGRGTMGRPGPGGRALPGRAPAGRTPSGKPQVGVPSAQADAIATIMYSPAPGQRPAPGGVMPGMPVPAMNMAPPAMQPAAGTPVLNMPQQAFQMPGIQPLPVAVPMAPAPSQMPAAVPIAAVQPPVLNMPSAGMPPAPPPAVPVLRPVPVPQPVPVQPPAMPVAQPAVNQQPVQQPAPANHPSA